jgi:hypothetical protein
MGGHRADHFRSQARRDLLELFARDARLVERVEREQYLEAMGVADARSTLTRRSTL